VDPFSFAPIAAVLDAAYAVVQGIASLLTPLAGSAAAALAVVAITLILRAVLIPVGAAQVRAEVARRRLAPRLQALQKRYRKNPQLLQQKTLELYREQKVSPMAGILPALAQLPVLSIVYALFIRTRIDGHANDLLGEHLFGTPLGTSLVHLISTGGGVAGCILFAALLLVIGAVAWLNRRTALSLAQPAEGTAASIAKAMSWMPFVTVIIAAFVPLAATLYLTTTTVWTFAERALLRRRYGMTGAASGPIRARRADATARVARTEPDAGWGER